MAFVYDDRNFQEMLEALDDVARAKAIRSAMRKSANHIKQVAVSNLRNSVNSTLELEKGIRTLVYKRVAGFKVTVGTKKGKRAKGFYRGRHAQRNANCREVPVLIWLEDGTAIRKTKSKTKFFKRHRKGHSTGRLKRYGFMAHTKSQVMGKVADDLHENIYKSVKNIASKYGCK